MEDYIILRIVAGLIFDNPVKDAEKIVEQNPSIPKCLLTNNFKDKIIFILFFKAGIVKHRWKKFVDTCYSKIFSSHETYLTFVLFACIRESERNPNIFESFMNICSLLNYMCFETQLKTGVHLSYLNPIISDHFCYMFHDNICKQGGGQRLIEFISDHRYLNYNFRGFFDSLADSVRFNAAFMDLQQQVDEELKKDCVMEEEIDVDEVANNEYCICVAKELLNSCTGLEHKILPSLDVVKSFVEYRKKEKSEIKLLEADKKSTASNILLDKSSNSITESKTNHATNHQENIEQYESIIQAVIRHNHSKSSGYESANNKIQDEANGVLQHLTETIEKLTKVLTNLTKIECS